MKQFAVNKGESTPRILRMCAREMTRAAWNSSYGAQCQAGAGRLNLHRAIRPRRATSRAEMLAACRTSARWGPRRARRGCFDRSELERDFWGYGSEPSGGSVGVPGRFRRGLQAAGWPDQGGRGSASDPTRTPTSITGTM
jgi:hypothetical protein